MIDICREPAREASPHLRCAPGGKQPVPFDDVMEALRTLDKEANAEDARTIGVYCAAAASRQRPRPYSDGQTLDQLRYQHLLEKSFGGKHVA